jgi:thiol:disulfide interchange protein DsbD
MNKLAYLLLLPLLSATKHPMPRESALSLRPVRWSVVGGSSVEVVSGRTVPITLQADIAKGWHIYSLTQKPGGPIPLSIQLFDARDVIVRGVVKAPKPERAFDKNFGIETELYSGTPRFTIPVGVPGSAKGTRKIQIGARFQVCSETLCLPPRTDKLGVTLRIRGRK